jgi:hypothetical protein
MVVGLDAKFNSQPTAGMTLTTHRADFDMGRFRWATAKLLRWLREDLGEDVEYCGMMEWSTGSGGHGRLPHMHTLLKGVAGSQATSCGADRKRDRCGACMECRTSIKWDQLTGGAWRVDVRELRTPGGAIAYMVGHHHKRDQAPPRREALKGMKRMRPSKGYFNSETALLIKELEGRDESPLARLRRQAKDSMREGAQKRAALAELAGFDAPHDVRDNILDELVADARVAEPPVLVKLVKKGVSVVCVATGEIVDESF